MQSLALELEVVTPLVLSGASQLDAELRPNSIKDLMRWWYRSAKGKIGDPQNSKEFELFGSTMEASKFLPRIKRAGSSAEIPVKKPISQTLFNSFPPGIKYLAFPFRPQKENNYEPHRSWINPDFRFPFSLTFLSSMSEDDKNLIMASLWLLLFFGGIGSRSRRGFGSVKVRNNFTHQPINLEFLFNRKDGDYLRFLQENLHRALKTIGYERTTQSVQEIELTTFSSPESRIYLYRDNFDSWENALNKAGECLKDFRDYKEWVNGGKILSRRNKGDYYSVRNFLYDSDVSPTQYKRAAFGLPIKTRYSRAGTADIQGGFKDAEDEDKDHDRRASPLFIKVLKSGHTDYRLLFVFLPARLLEAGESLKIKAKTGHKLKDYCPPPNFTIVGDFLDEKIVPNSDEITF